MMARAAGGFLRAVLAAVGLALVHAQTFNGCISFDASRTPAVVRTAAPDTVCGAGATLAQSLYQLASFAYAQYGTVGYTGTGSSTGKRSAVAHTVDVAGSDSLISSSQYTTAPDLQMYPAVAAAVVPVYNIKALRDQGLDLVLDRATLPAIFLGDIYEWTDPAILAIQPGGANGQIATILKNMADPTITPVVRNDGSGTTEIFTVALGLFEPTFTTRAGSSDVLDWCEDGVTGVCLLCPTNVGCKAHQCEGVSWLQNSGFGTSGEVTCQKPSHGGRQWKYVRGEGNAGVVAGVFSIDGSIGYAVLADAVANGVPFAQLINRAGKAVVAGPTSVSFALMELGGNLDERGNAELMDAASTFSWPIAGYTYFVLRKGIGPAPAFVNYMLQAPSMYSCETRVATLAFLEWFYTSPTTIAIGTQLGFTMLPDFIARNLLADMLSENYCDPAEPVLAKEPAKVQLKYAFVAELASPLFANYVSVYREVDPRITWSALATTGDARVHTLLVNTSIPMSAAYGSADIVSGIGVQAIEAAGIANAAVPDDIVAAHLFTAAIAPLVHLGSAPAPTLTLEQIASIYLGNVTKWSEIDPALANTDIIVALRTDESDVTAVVTATLSRASAEFAAAIGVKQRLEPADWAALGSRVRLTTSNAQTAAIVAFSQSAFGMWARLGGASSPIARVARAAGSPPITLSADTIAKCINEPEARVSLTSAKIGRVSRVYDAGASTSDDCWPFSRAYALVIKEDLVGPSQCAPSGSIIKGDGISLALEFASWLFTGDDISNTISEIGAVPANSSLREVVLSALYTYDCNPAPAASSGGSSGGGGGGGSSSSTVINLGRETDLTPIIAGVCAGVAFLICCGVAGMWYYKRRLDILSAFANAKLPDNVQQVLEETYTEIFELDSGEVAQYIPELRDADPEKFGIVLCDLEGTIYSVGDTEVPFSIQSACKPILYMLAMDAKGKAEVATKIGEEPSGLPFNAVNIDPHNRAFNPYVNAGAIVSASMLDTINTAEARYTFFEDQCKKMAYVPERCKLDRSVYQSEMATNSNNQMIADTLHAKNIIEKSPNVALDAYTRACSLLVTAEDAAVMAATFANRGVNPVTGEQVMNEDLANHTVTVMMSCGMYNGAGRWIVDVGIPAKSGVAGLIMCVVPGVCGFAVFSPRLDPNGNSARGVLVAKSMSESLGLHVLKSKDEQGGSPFKKKRNTSEMADVMIKGSTKANKSGGNKGGIKAERRTTNSEARRSDITVGGRRSGSPGVGGRKSGDARVAPEPISNGGNGKDVRTRATLED